LDDSGAIEFDEFFTQGEMQLTFKDSDKTANSNDPFARRKLIKFDLNDPDAIELSSWRLSEDKDAVSDKMDWLVYRDLDTKKIKFYLSGATIKFNSEVEF